MPLPRDVGRQGCFPRAGFLPHGDASGSRFPHRRSNLRYERLLPCPVGGWPGNCSWSSNLASTQEKAPRNCFRGAPALVEPGGQRVPTLSSRAGLCLHPSIACAMKSDAGRVIRARVARILVSAPPLPGRPIHESLQGRKSWPLSTPRRCHVACSDLRVHRMSPVCTALFRTQATIAFPCLNRTPVHKPYVPRPTYVATSIDLAARYPTGRES